MNFRETFLQFVWKFQLFQTSALTTVEGDTLVVFNPGYLNSDAGPDYLEAKLLINQIEWHGNIELHVNSSDWTKHNHQLNKAFDNVILHVVWKCDVSINRTDATNIPTLELRNLVSNDVIIRYEQLVKTNDQYIPCASQFSKIPMLTKLAMLDKMLISRLEQKGKKAKELLISNNNDWEETAYQLLATNFGFKINNEPFLILARIIPYKLLLKHKNSILQIEALLFGGAGFLEDSIGDDYYLSIKKEFDFLQKKYLIKPMDVSNWKFLRLRPANFPTLRISQFAMFIYQSNSIFSFLIELNANSNFKKEFQIVPSKYWQHNYQFNKVSSGKNIRLGDFAIENLLINSVVPLLVLYSKERSKPELMEEAIKILEITSVESNKITKIWSELGLSLKSAYDSQGATEWYNNYCKQKNCLNCNVGVSIIRQ